MFSWELAVSIALPTIIFFVVLRWRTELLPEPVLRKLTPISFVGGLLAAIGFVYAIYWIRMQPFGQAVLGSFFVFIIVYLAVSFCVLFYRKGAAGRTVLDLGPSPYRKSLLWSAACFLPLGVFNVVLVVFNVGYDLGKGRNINIDVVDMLGFIAMTVSAVYFLALALDRLQIWEKGIWFFGGLIKWDKIDSYDWDEDFLLVQKKVRFLVQKKVRFPFGAKVRIRVPPEHKDSVEELLKEHCSSDA